MQIGTHHIGYCLNIYPGRYPAEILNHIRRDCADVKAAVCPDEPMGIGLWLPAPAAAGFLRDTRPLQHLLKSQELYAFSVNAFPYGEFHEGPVKTNVYQPDWSTSKRLRYTLDAARVLAALLPEGLQEGSVSTVPVAYGKNLDPKAVENLNAAARGLERIEDQTGKRIRLALEPEPDCLLENSEECIAFFETLRTTGGRLTERYVGVCFDVCHFAVQFEDPVSALDRFEQGGVPVVKIQVSAALQLENPSEEALRELNRFDDGIYLHQTRVQNGTTIARFGDLAPALQAAPHGCWRIHFHVPLHYRSPDTGLQSTALLLDDRFFRRAVNSSTHIETETYTYAVLPDASQNANRSVVAELQFVRERIVAAQGAD